jgi:hypothetical protein
MRMRFVVAFLFAAILLLWAPPARATFTNNGYTCDLTYSTSCPLSYELWLASTCYTGSWHGCFW